MLAYFYEKFPASSSAIRSDLTSERVDQFVDNYINKDKKKIIHITHLLWTNFSTLLKNDIHNLSTFCG